MAEPLKPPYLHKDETRGDYQVWIVDGAYVRGHIDEEFTNFGQHCRYPYIPEKEFWIDQEAEHDERAFFLVYEFVPEGEIWIDDAIEKKERGFVLLHELHDALAAEGWA